MVSTAEFSIPSTPPDRHPRSMPLSQGNIEPLFVALHPQHQHYVLVEPGQGGIPLSEIDSGNYTGDLPEFDERRGKSLLAVTSPQFTTSLERISRLRVNTSWLNKSVNTRDRTTAEMRALNNEGWWIMHTTSRTGSENGPLSVLRFGSVPHIGPNGELLVPSWTDLFPAIPTGPGGTWEIFEYLDRKKIANHAGKGEIRDPITGQRLVDIMNGRSTGTEVDNSGNKAIKQEQFDMLVAKGLQRRREGVIVARMIGHKNWTTRKFDPQAACYDRDNVTREIERLWAILQGQPPIETGLLPTGWYEARRDGFRTRVRTDYKNAQSHTALMLEPGAKIKTDKTYKDGALVNGSRRWIHVEQAEFQGKIIEEPGFVHESRSVDIDDALARHLEPQRAILSADSQIGFNQMELVRLLLPQATQQGAAEAAFFIQSDQYTSREALRRLQLEINDPATFLQSALCQ